MSDKKNIPIDIVTALEQSEATLVNLAPILASFYQALLKESVPDELAHQLVRDFFTDLMSRNSSA